MKKILVMSINDSLGGAELYLKTIANHFSDEKLDIAFLTNNNSKSWQDLQSKSKISFYAKRSKFIGALRFSLHSIFNKKKYDYVFSSHIHTNALLSSLRALGILKTEKLICRESTSIFIRYRGMKLFFYKLIYRIGYRKIDLLVCQTELMKNQLMTNFGRIERMTKVTVISNLINLRAIENLAKEHAKYQFEYIVAAGRLIYEKGFDILIEAFAKIKQEKPELKLIILGNGELLEDLKRLSLSHNLNQDIIFEGHVKNVFPYFKKAKVCVVSSRVEGFPNVLLQMMSQNETIVSTKCAGGIDNIPGIICCETNSMEALYLALAKAINRKTTRSNRQIFDTYLQSRDVDTYLKTIVRELSLN